MDIVITLNENDLMKNPNIIDMVKSFANSLKDPKADAAAANIGFTHTPSEPVDEDPVEDVRAYSDHPAEENAPWEEPVAEQEAEPVAEKAAEVTVSIEELRAAIAKVSKKHGAAAAKKILQDHGAESLSALDPKFYAVALEEAKAVL